MTYSDVQLLMEKLKQLINCNDNPLINILEIKHEKPQFQLLYEDLCSIIQTLSINDLPEHEKLNDLKKRFKDAAVEAQYTIDLFLSGVQKKNNENFPASEEDIKPFLSLDDVRSSFNTVKVELMSMGIDSLKMDSTQKPERKLNQSAAAPRNSQGSKKIEDEMIVGIDDDAKLIKDKLMEDGRKLDVISIVGMGGIGKTTLATEVFNDDYVKYHFHVRVWVTVSQTYDKRGVLIQILESIGGESDLGVASDSWLRELVHKKLMGKRYLIVIDDIWHIETWDKLKIFFPCDNNGSRILLTSRQIDVAKHATLDHGLIHQLGYLNKEKGWELLCKKVFHGNDYPEWSVKPRMQIVENCKGLPLAVAIIAGVLIKETLSEKFWMKIADRTGAYIVGDENGSIMETLGLSFIYLPPHLRECFLYLGGFPEDYEFRIQRLIWLWVAEGFIQEDRNRSLEDIAEGYLMDLIDRNLVIEAERSKSNTKDVKAFKLHDLVRELCLRKAKEEGFILQTLPSHFSTPPPYKPVRMFINKDSNIEPYLSIDSIRSFLCFIYMSDDISKYLRSFVLLRVLDLQLYHRKNFPKGMDSLVHLRYLAIQTEINEFPSSICNLWGLQTLIYITKWGQSTKLPSNISNLLNLRHLLSYHPYRSSQGKGFFILPSIEKPMNLLQTFTNVELGDEALNFQTCIPYVKKLGCFFTKKTDFKSLTCLEKLRLTSNFGLMEHMIKLPSTLKALTLQGCGLAWSEMSIIQALPNLQVLKLHEDAFVGRCWNSKVEHQGGFSKLKFLRLRHLDIKHWKAADSTSFPRLKQLEIRGCNDLEEIPLEIGDIPTLELIQISYCRPSVGESVRRIQKQQNDLGNCDLKVDIGSSLWIRRSMKNKLGLVFREKLCCLKSRGNTV